MASPRNVAVTIPSLTGSATGSVTDVWHAVDGVRVQVRFPLDGAPLLPVGRAGELAFFRADTRQSMSALGKVAHRNEGEDSRVYHFLFGDRTRQFLAMLLEPRRAQRVYPDPDEPVDLTVLVPGSSTPIVAAVRDVSISGVGIDIPWEHEATLSKTRSLAIRIGLPRAKKEFEFETYIRNRSLGQGAIIYGLEFKAEALTANDPRIAAIDAYVVDCEAKAMSARRLESA